VCLAGAASAEVTFDDLIRAFCQFEQGPAWDLLTGICEPLEFSPFLGIAFDAAARPGSREGLVAKTFQNVFQVEGKMPARV